jgi:hypothetical protein
MLPNIPIKAKIIILNLLALIDLTSPKIPKHTPSGNMQKVMIDNNELVKPG